MAPIKKTSDKKTEKRKQLKRSDYDKLKRTAYEYVVVQGLDQKVVANMLNISEATLSKWSKEGRWREERESRQHTSSVDVENTKKLLSLLAKQRLTIETQIQTAINENNAEEEVRLRKKASAITDDMSKINKTLMTISAKNYTLGVFIDVMDEIFNALRNYDESLWAKTVDFQGILIRKKTIDIG